MRCPECDGPLEKPDSMHYTDLRGQRHKVFPTGVWCRSNICSYGGLEEDPETEHPTLHILRFLRSDDVYFSDHCNLLAITGTERTEKACAGNRKFVNSRLTLQTVVMYVISDQNFSDEVLLKKFPVLTQAILTEIRQTVRKYPPPNHGKVTLEIDIDPIEPLSIDFFEKPYVMHLRV